jgi:N-methylhydantoinase A/oxoprolinase/acetone carboxylase beta subunit
LKLTLGIDAGGTYTDAVLLDPNSGQVRFKAKALTTLHDLSIGIARAIDGLDGANSLTEPSSRAQVEELAELYQQVKLVSISTTLATNAIVEGQGGQVGLLLIGYDEEIMERSGLAKRLPVEGMRYVAGGHDVKGEEICPLDTETARQAILEFRGQVEALAVSGYFSVMNPDHELRVRQIMTALTTAPIVCGHELTGKLNALKRVSTAVLNARLLPVIQHLLDSVKKVLVERGIDAPLMVVKGDGSLIGEKMARRRPVETILSGPAASAIGGQFLAGLDRAIAVDMGGTTTDIAVLKDGQPWTNPAGATVGGWQTSVQAADLRTIGIGGDSHVRVERGRTLRVGPRRAIPLCWLGAEWPEIVRELEGAVYAGAGEESAQPTDFLTIARPAGGLPLTESEESILRALRCGPLSISRLGHRLGRHYIPCKRLEEAGVLRRASLTPTDVLWSESSDIGGNGAAARAGTQVVARQLEISVAELTRRVLGQVVDKVAKEVLDKVVSDETGHSLFPTPRAWEFLLARSLGHGNKETVNCQVQVHQPIVAIGAPVAAFMPQVADKLQTRCIIPPDAEVGNAVGAVVASVSYRVAVLVQPHVLGAGTVAYLIRSPRGREQAGASFARAVMRAEAIAVEMARKFVYKAGARAVSVKVERKKVTLGKLSEMTVRACATGRPRLAK